MTLAFFKNIFEEILDLWDQGFKKYFIGILNLYNWILIFFKGLSESYIFKELPELLNVDLKGYFFNDISMQGLSELGKWIL